MNRRTPLLFLGALALVATGSALGSLVTVALLPTAPAPARASASPARTEEDLALRCAIEELGRVLRERPAATRSECEEPTPRLPAAASDVVPLADLGRPEATELDARERARTIRRGIETLADSVHAPSPEQRELMQALRAIGFEQRQKTHRFWTYRQVLERYGSPDEIQGDASMSWFYEDPYTGRTTTLKFCEGVLIAVYD